MRDNTTSRTPTNAPLTLREKAAARSVDAAAREPRRRRRSVHTEAAAAAAAIAAAAAPGTTPLERRTSSHPRLNTVVPVGHEPVSVSIFVVVVVAAPAVIAPEAAVAPVEVVCEARLQGQGDRRLVVPR